MSTKILLKRWKNMKKFIKEENKADTLSLLLDIRNNLNKHLHTSSNYPDKFKNEKLSEKWSELIKIRNICNISIEEKRASKEIGSSLEADLKINLNQKLQKVISNIDFSELCITSKAEVSYNEDVETTAITSKAKGTKCPVCWKINEGPCPRHP